MDNLCSSNFNPKTNLWIIYALSGLSFGIVDKYFVYSKMSVGSFRDMYSHFFFI